MGIPCGGPISRARLRRVLDFSELHVPETRMLPPSSAMPRASVVVSILFLIRASPLNSCCCGLLLTTGIALRAHLNPAHTVLISFDKIRWLVLVFGVLFVVASPLQAKLQFKYKRDRSVCLDMKYVLACACHCQ